MNAVLIVITVVQLLVALALILIVLFQSGKSQGLSGAIGGIADSYMSRSKAKSMDAKLDKQQAVTETKLEELTREVRMHNNFAQRVPVLEEQMKVANHRIADLEKERGE